MAVRLPVVLCQHALRNGQQAEHEEQWITMLLFEDRLDATLVSDLAQIELDSTDHLCLEGLRGDFVLVSWQSKEKVAEQLSRLGFDSLELVPLDGTEILVLANSNSLASKKVYFLSFELGRTVDAGLSRLKELLASRSTPVFQLNTNLSKARTNLEKPVESRLLPILNTPITPLPPPAPSMGSKASALGASSAFIVQHSPSESGVDLSDDSDFPHIDSLMSDLDKFDI